MEERKRIILTGDRPTGKLHLGHIVGSIRNRLALQSSGNGFFYMVADVQALSANANNPEKVRGAVYDVILDNLACGLDPEKVTFFIQSQIPAIAELSVYFSNLVTLARAMRNPTIKTEMREKGFDDATVPVGFLTHPIHQAADILAFKANLVPAGEDQLPLIEQANEIVERFNAFYPAHPAVFSRIDALLPEEKAARRLPGTDGKGKMGKSLGNALFISDSSDEVEKKVTQMYTDPNHVRAEDPGNIEGNVVFTYLDAFDPNKEELAELKNRYQRGGVGDVEIKKRLIGILNDFLDPIREKRAYFEKNLKDLSDIIETGTKKARQISETTLREAKEAMKINYFTS